MKWIKCREKSNVFIKFRLNIKALSHNFMNMLKRIKIFQKLNWNRKTIIIMIIIELFLLVRSWAVAAAVMRQQACRF